MDRVTEEHLVKPSVRSPFLCWVPPLRTHVTGEGEGREAEAPGTYSGWDIGQTGNSHGSQDLRGHHSQGDQRLQGGEKCRQSPRSGVRGSVEAGGVFVLRSCGDGEGGTCEHHTRTMAPRCVQGRMAMPEVISKGSAECLAGPRRL